MFSLYGRRDFLSNMLLLKIQVQLRLASCCCFSTSLGITLSIGLHRYQLASSHLLLDMTAVIGWFLSRRFGRLPDFLRRGLFYYCLFS